MSVLPHHDISDWYVYIVIGMQDTCLKFMNDAFSLLSHEQFSKG